MQNTFIIFNKMQDEMVFVEKRTDEDYAVVLNKDITIKPAELFTCKTELIVKPVNDKYKIYSNTCELEAMTFLVHFYDLEDNNDNFTFCIANATNKEITLSKGNTIGHLYAAKPALKDFENPYYMDDYLFIKELKQGVIQNFAIVDDPKEGKSLILNFNSPVGDS